MYDAAASGYGGIQCRLEREQRVVYIEMRAQVGSCEGGAIVGHLKPAAACECDASHMCSA